MPDRLTYNIMKIHDFAGDSMRFVHLMVFRLPADRKLFLSSDLQVLSIL